MEELALAPDAPLNDPRLEPAAVPADDVPGEAVNLGATGEGSETCGCELPVSGSDGTVTVGFGAGGRLTDGTGIGTVTGGGCTEGVDTVGVETAGVESVGGKPADA